MAVQVGLSLTRSQTSKTGFLVTRFINDNMFRLLSAAFLNANSKADIIKAGEDLIIHSFGGVSLEGLNFFAVQKLWIALPVYKSTRCHQHLLQQPSTANKSISKYKPGPAIILWLQKTGDGNWLRTTPVKSDLPPAPEKLLQNIRCNCKHNCDTKRFAVVENMVSIVLSAVESVVVVVTQILQAQQIQT